MQTTSTTVQAQGNVRKPLADIRTAKRSEPDTSNHFFSDGKALDGGFVVPIGFYNTVKLETISILNYLAEANEYDGEDLFGSEFFNQLQPFEQRLVDPVLKTLIAEGDVPLRLANPARTYPVLYQLDVGHATLVKRSEDGYTD
jgi:hypothetical protein